MGNLSIESRYLTSFKHIGHRTLLLLKIRRKVRVELGEAGSTEGMPAMDHDSRDALERIIIEFT